LNSSLLLKREKRRIASRIEEDKESLEEEKEKIEKRKTKEQEKKRLEQAQKKTEKEIEDLVDELKIELESLRDNKEATEERMSKIIENIEKQKDIINELKNKKKQVDSFEKKTMGLVGGNFPEVEIDDEKVEINTEKLKNEANSRLDKLIEEAKKEKNRLQNELKGLRRKRREFKTEEDLVIEYKDKAKKKAKEHEREINDTDSLDFDESISLRVSNLEEAKKKMNKL
jgi:hypothetical protein